MNIRMSEATDILAPPGDDPLLFAFQGPHGIVQGRGAPVQVPRGAADTVAARVARALSDARPGAMIGGALPFDRTAADCLWLCARSAPQPVGPTQDRDAPDGDAAMPASGWRLSAEPSPGDYARAVARALAIMQAESGRAGGLEKIVLARSLRAEAPAPIPLDALMQRLGRDPAATAFRVALPPQGMGARHLCGATPELLVSKSGALVASHPLAGSARRVPDDAQADRAAARQLMASDKDHREHALVVESILDVLSPWCRTLGAPDGTQLAATCSMWHLGTRIEGVLKDPEMPSVVLATLLHPTPAVCGVPMARAHALIHDLEPVPRDFYAGAVGWCDGRGDGAWYVAIRCAEIAGATARLYAGAGIVPGSDPMAEAAETGAKFGALLAALGLPADAGLPDAPRNEVR